MGFGRRKIISYGKLQYDYQTIEAILEISWNLRKIKFLGDFSTFTKMGHSVPIPFSLDICSSMNIYSSSNFTIGHRL